MWERIIQVLVYTKRANLTPFPPQPPPTLPTHFNSFCCPHCICPSHPPASRSWTFHLHSRSPHCERCQGRLHGDGTSDLPLSCREDNGQWCWGNTWNISYYQCHGLMKINWEYIILIKISNCRSWSMLVHVHIKSMWEWCKNCFV